MTPMTRRALFAAALASAAAAVALVGPAGAQELRVGVQNMAAYIDPGRDHSNVGSQQYYNAFDTLIDKDHTKVEGVWQPGLATAWTRTSATTMELTIRRDVTFHNGDPMTVEDVVFSLDRIINATFPPYQIRQKDFVPNFARVEKIGDWKIRVTSRRPEPLFETLLNIQQLMIVPKRYMASLSGNPGEIEPSDFEAFGLRPVGTGPYRITEFVPNQRLVYERFDGFWGARAPFARITLLRIPELSARLTALKTGEVDLVTNVPPDQIATLEGDGRLKVEGMVTPLFHVIIFNTQHPQMRNPKLRQALSLAVDRETLNKALWLGKAVVPASHTYPQYGRLYMPELQTFAYDPVKAKELLAESGYDGFPIRFDSFPTYYTNGLLAAQAIREMWAAIGVKTNINVEDKWTGSDPAMMVRNWSNPLYFPDPAGSFGTMWAPGAASQSEKRFNPDATYVQAWERFRYSTDVAERRKAYAQLMEMIKADPPLLVLYRPYEAYGLKRSLSWRPLPGHIPYVLDFRAGRITLAAR